MNVNVKIMVQFVNINPNSEQKLVIIHLWLRKASMEMDCNLKKLASFFQVSSEYFRKMAKHRLWFILTRRNHFIFSSHCSKNNFVLEKTDVLRIMHEQF